MGSMVVRNPDDAVIAALKRRAEARGTSPEQLARETLTEAARLSPDKFLAATDALRARLPNSGDDSTAYMRAVRDGEAR